MHFPTIICFGNSLMGRGTLGRGTFLGRRYQSISVGEHIGREIQGIEGRRGKRRRIWQRRQIET